MNAMLLTLPLLVAAPVPKELRVHPLVGQWEQAMEPVSTAAAQLINRCVWTFTEAEFSIHYDNSQFDSAGRWRSVDVGVIEFSDNPAGERLCRYHRDGDRLTFWDAKSQRFELTRIRR